MKHVVPLGSITIFTNYNGEQGALDDEILNEVNTAIAEAMKKRVDEIFGPGVLVITDARTTTGCIITVITLGAIIKASGIAAAAGVTAKVAYNIIKDYDQFKTGLNSLCKDIKNGWLKITGKKKDNKGPTDAEATFYTNLPAEFRKLHASGQDNVLYSREESTTTTRTTITTKDSTTHTTTTTSVHKVTLMRDDTPETAHELVARIDEHNAVPLKEKEKKRKKTQKEKQGRKKHKKR